MEEEESVGCYTDQCKHPINIRRKILKMLNNVGHHRLNSHLMDTFLSCQLMNSFISYVLYFKELFFFNQNVKWHW